MLDVSEWSALKTGATAALGRHTVSADAGNYTTTTCLSYFTHTHTQDIIRSVTNTVHALSACVGHQL